MPTDEQKAKILEHIYYEILRCFCFEEGEQHISESWISHMVHARVLLEFFESEKPRVDDVVCSQFGFRAAKVVIDPEHWTRFNKDVHHLTYARLRHTPKTKGWDIRAALGPLAQRAIDFMDHIISAPPAGAAADEIQRWKVLRNFMTQSEPPLGKQSSSGVGL